MSNEMTKKEKIDDILSRGVGEFFDPDGIFRKKLENNPEKIVIKFGVDPTRPDIHIGHAVVLHKLRKFQDLGCKVVFLIGDYTAQIGDPTGKDITRPEINIEEINKNTETYEKQISSILNVSDKNKYVRLRNSIWFQSPTDYIGKDMVEKSIKWQKDREEFIPIRGQLPTITVWNLMYTLKNITHSQLIERDMFQKRINAKKHLFMHEMMYPVLQGTDSNTIAGFFGSCDLEVGGTDQTFNMLMGRPIMKSNNFEPQAVLAFKLLEGLDGKEKMSKSLDNYIGITDEPNNMYGKTMSIPDSSIGNYFELCTFTPLAEVEKIRKSIIDGAVNPKDLKMKLARQIVAIYHGEKKAEEAEENWEKTFSKKEIPEDVEIFEVKENDLLVDIFLKNKIVSSKGEYRRLVDEKAITNLDTNEKISNTTEKIKEGTYRIGKKRFCRIEIK